MSQSDMAKRLGIKLEAYRKFELGALPNSAIRKKLSDILKTSEIILWPDLEKQVKEALFPGVIKITELMYSEIVREIDK